MIVGDWRQEGCALIRDVVCRDFEEALRFVEEVADEAVDYQRRPYVAISELNRVRLTIENPNHAGITAAEQRLREKVDAVVDRRAQASA